VRRALLVGGLVAVLMATGALFGPSPATAAEGRGPTVCPASDFWVGAGWGADRGSRRHAGIDLGGDRGSPIYAVETGRIDRTKLQSNGALQIVMRGKSGSMYYYGHMDKVLIKGGQRVKAGDVIGLMGDTGSPGQVHLHFEYWKSGRESDPVDPEPLINEICNVKKGKGGTSATPDPEPAPAPEPQPEPEPTPTPAPKPGDAAVIGEVFTNA
jgi:murein DD-endopeptidase MepM/ murein hydrolase activator NlpD